MGEVKADIRHPSGIGSLLYWELLNFIYDVIQTKSPLQITLMTQVIIIIRHLRVFKHWEMDITIYFISLLSLITSYFNIRKQIKKIVETSDNKSLKTILRILHFFLHESNIPKFTAGVTVLSSIPLVVFEKLELVEWYGVVMSSAKSSIFLIALFDILVTFLLGKGLQDTIIKVFDTPAFRIEVRTSFNTTLECTDVLDLECKKCKFVSGGLMNHLPSKYFPNNFLRIHWKEEPKSLINVNLFELMKTVKREEDQIIGLDTLTNTYNNEFAGEHVFVRTTAISRPARKNNFIGRGKPDEIAEFTLFEDSLQGKGKVKMSVKFRTDKRSGFFQVTLKYLLCVNYVFFRVFETKIYSTGNKLTKVSVKKESTFEDLLKHGSDTFLDENKLSKWMTVVSEKFELMMPDRENN